MKNSQTVDVSYGLQVPSTTAFDTTISVSGKVIVKYDDNNFYPLYIVYYRLKRSIDGGGVRQINYSFRDLSLF